MTKYWLRTHIDGIVDGKNITIFDKPSVKKYTVGDKIVLHISQTVPKRKYLVGIYTFEGGLTISPDIYLLKPNWVRRPENDSWTELLRKSLEKNTNFNLDETKWIGRVSSEGLELVEDDFNKLKNLIEKNI